LNTQVTENGNISTEVTNNEKTIAKLAAEISQLASDLQALRSKNELEIENLERQRAENEKTIISFKNQLTKADHDYSSLKILIQKA